MIIDLTSLIKVAMRDTSTEPYWAWLEEIEAMIKDGGIASRSTQNSENKCLIYVDYRGKKFFHASREPLLTDLVS